MIEATVVYESAYKGQKVTKVFKGYIDIFTEGTGYVLLYDEKNETVIEVPYSRVYNIQYAMSKNQKMRLQSLRRRESEH